MSQPPEPTDPPTQTTPQQHIVGEMGNILFYTVAAALLFGDLHYRWLPLLNDTVAWGLILTCVLRTIIAFFRIASLNKSS